MTDRREADERTIRDLYPDLTDDELAAAEENLDRYVAVVLSIYERIRENPEAYAEFKALTGANPSA